jgi:uncharacterized protein (DUF1697 family)
LKSPTAVDKLLQLADTIKPEEDVLLFGNDSIREKIGIDFKPDYVGIVPISANNIILAEEKNS